MNEELIKLLATIGLDVETVTSKNVGSAFGLDIPQEFIIKGTINKEVLATALKTDE